LLCCPTAVCCAFSLLCSFMSLVACLFWPLLLPSFFVLCSAFQSLFSIICLVFFLEWKLLFLNLVSELPFLLVSLSQIGAPFILSSVLVQPASSTIDSRSSSVTFHSHGHTLFVLSFQFFQAFWRPSDNRLKNDGVVTVSTFLRNPFFSLRLSPCPSISASRRFS
jgi:hypothetical protein